jgi:hypothetical protein
MRVMRVCVYVCVCLRARASRVACVAYALRVFCVRARPCAQIPAWRLRRRRLAAVRRAKREDKLNKVGEIKRSGV